MYVAAVRGDCLTLRGRVRLAAWVMLNQLPELSRNVASMP